MRAGIVFLLFFSVAFCEKAFKVEVTDIHGPFGRETEVVDVELKRSNVNGFEDVDIKVKLYFYLVDNRVHCNGVALEHKKIIHLHMQMILREFHSNGNVENEREVPVVVRLYVGEIRKDGKDILFVEQKFLLIEGREVEQLDIQRVIWEDSVRHVKPLRYSESELRKQEHNKEVQHIHRNQMPAHLPNKPYAADDKSGMYEELDNHRHHHHHHHHHHVFRSVKCWFRHLHKPAKIAVISAGALFIMALIFAVTCCVKRQRRRRQTLFIESPLDDNVEIDTEKKDTKANDDEKYNFHFEVDNAVVVDDKKVLIE